MKLVSTLSWSALASIIRLASSFLVLKFIAVIIGPAGVAIVAQFGNIVTIIMTLALGGITSGLLKYTADFKNDLDQLSKIWRTTTWISITLTTPIIFILIFAHNWLAVKFLHDAKYGSIFIIFAFSLILYVLLNP